MPTSKPIRFDVRLPRAGRFFLPCCLVLPPYIERPETHGRFLDLVFQGHFRGINNDQTISWARGSFERLALSGHLPSPASNQRLLSGQSPTVASQHEGGQCGPGANKATL